MDTGSNPPARPADEWALEEKTYDDEQVSCQNSQIRVQQQRETADADDEK